MPAFNESHKYTSISECIIMFREFDPFLNSKNDKQPPGPKRSNSGAYYKTFADSPLDNCIFRMIKSKCHHMPERKITSSPVKPVIAERRISYGKDLRN